MESYFALTDLTGNETSYQLCHCRMATKKSNISAHSRINKILGLFFGLYSFDPSNKLVQKKSHAIPLKGMHAIFALFFLIQLFEEIF